MNCISLFTGCGGLDIGLEEAGFSIKLATDVDQTCSKSYRLNKPDTPYVVDSIGEIQAVDLMRKTGVSQGEIDLLAGGPPCPAFSKSRFYRPDKPRALDDPVAAETVGGYLRMLRDIRPKTFLLENVRGLAYGIHKQALMHILDTAESLGYATTWRILNAADFGVPQIRERCIVMGSLYGRIDFPAPTHSKSPDNGSMELKEWVTAGSVLKDLDTEKNASDEGHFAGGKYHEALCGIPPGQNYLFYTEKRGHPNPLFKWRSRYWSFLLKLSPDLPSWTIQARRSNNMGPFHWRNRILRIEEIKRLQSFPDDYKLVGTIENQWRQIGNAVPPRLGFHLGRVIYKHLADNDRLPIAL